MVFLVPISLALLGLAVWAFVWAVRRGQFDDLETPAVQILVDEPSPRTSDVEQDTSVAADADEAAGARPAHDDDGQHAPRAD
ncbi:cbb3-type cytochrome oxidase assembly protein CcoS [Alkalisalibacterium limincola]|nr:cbb3-type cytochrome oxidase assembly protein CcoS [Alkalisalibacterium limincola]